MLVKLLKNLHSVASLYHTAKNVIKPQNTCIL